MKVQQMKGKNKVLYFIYLPKSVMKFFGLEKGNELIYKFNNQDKSIIIKKYNTDETYSEEDKQDYHS